MLKYVMVASLFFVHPCLSQDLNEPTQLEMKCDNALSLCGAVIEAQAAQIEHLNLRLDEANDLLAKSVPEPILPDWAWVAIGVAIGGTVGYAVSR